MKPLLVWLVLGAVPVLAAPKLNAPFDLDHLASRMKALGFACSSDGAGSVCTGSVASYPRPVAILVPRAYRPGQNADVVLYLHGNNPDGNTLGWYLEHQQLARAINRSHRNAVMVFPSSLGGATGKTEDYDTHLGTPEGFEKFMNDMARVIQKSGLAASSELHSVVLSGHSGAYRSLTRIATTHHAYSGRIREFYCLDCVYWRHDLFVDFARDKDHRLWTVYSDAETAADTSCVIDKLQAAGIAFAGCAPRVGTCPAPGVNDTPPGTDNAACKPQDRRAHFSKEEFASQRMGFVHSSVDHDSVPKTYLGPLLGGEP